MDTVCRSRSFLAIFAVLTLLRTVFGAVPAIADNGVCCVFEGQAECETTSTVTMCAILAKAAGKKSEPVCGKVCGLVEGKKRCINAVACFTCVPGGQECELASNCPEPGAQCKATSITRTQQVQVNETMDGIIVSDGLVEGDPGGEPLQCFADLEPPLCNRVATRPGPPVQIDIEVQDTNSGLASVDILVSDNASVPPPDFTVGTNAPVVLTATKTDPNFSSRVELRVFDVAGNSTLCDPILTEVVRGTGKPVSESHANLSSLEDTVTIYNGNPGLNNLKIDVNGVPFRVTGLVDNETRTVDISGAMSEGSENVVALTSYGAPGTSATVLIWDGGSD
jgi:hypothetical protein